MVVEVVALEQLVLLHQQTLAVMVVMVLLHLSRVLL
jgi:hypothetical protein